MISRARIAMMSMAIASAPLFAQSPAERAAAPASLLLSGDAAIPRAARFEAARQLMLLGSPDARRALADALQNRANPAIQAAAASALADDDSPEALFNDPLFVLIQPDVTIDIARPAARALAHNGSEGTVLARLITRTADRRGEPSRRATIESLGLIPEKRAARTLIDLISNDDESRDVRLSAVNALAYMAGGTGGGEDVGRWITWWEARQNQSDGEFRATLLNSKASRYDVLKPTYEQLLLDLRDQLGSLYRSVPADRRQEQLLGMLASGQPAIRAVGAMIVREDKNLAAVVPDAVQERLKSMVSDVDPQVRLSVANALGALNYAPALEPMLNQLSAEQSPGVRVALARALAPMNDLRAVGPLVALLKDGDRSVGRAAAIALKDLGQKLRREGDEPMVQQAAIALRDALRQARGPGSEEFREACVEAMAPLQQIALLPDLQQLLRPRETPRIRRSAVKALAAFGTRELADSIAPMLADTDASVRIEAARALQRIGRPADIQSLRQRLAEANEPDPSVQDAAWSAIETIVQLEDMPADALAAVASDFSANTDRDRERKLTILKARQAKLLASRKIDDLAEVREDIGRTYMKFTPPQAADAINFYKLALDDYKAINSTNGTVRMTEELMRAYLQAGQYTDAVGFAIKSIAEDARNTDSMGVAIRERAEQLYRDNADADALVLIAESAKISPPLPERFQRELQTMETSIRQRAGDQLRDNAGRPPGGPRSASGRQSVVPSIPVL